MPLGQLPRELLGSVGGRVDRPQERALGTPLEEADLALAGALTPGLACPKIGRVADEPD